MAKGAWLIQGFDGNRRTLRRRVSSAVSDREIKALLQRLVSRHLNVNEVIAGSLRKSMKAYSPVLQVSTEPRHRTIYWCGENPHYIASFHTDYEWQDLE
ncbi:MAG: hypothetical protein ABIK36_16275 [Pseudomonadota bacterium]